MIRLLSLLVFWAAAVGSASAAERRNVVVFLTDDQGWGDLSGNGNLDLATPNIDGLARTGASFDHFFVQPVCSPTRAEFLTGRYASRSGVTRTSSGGERMALAEKTIGDSFKAAGYKTGIFGKWHNGMQWPYHPNARGFDEFYGFCSGHWAHYFDPEMERNGEIVRGNGYIIDDLTNRAMQFMEAAGDQPFLIYLPYNTPHSPMQVPAAAWDKFKDKELRMPQPGAPQKDQAMAHTRAALAMCENIDWNVGRVLQKLDALGKSQDTIVVYFCDNGPNGRRWNGGMKGIKGSTDEGGVRSPLFIRWPGRITAGTVIKPIAGAIDLLPTLTNLAGIQRVGKLPLDGKSLKPLLLGDSEAWSDRTLVNFWANQISVRAQSHRLDHKGKLYDMVADPGQTRAINSEAPEMVERLAKIAADYRKNAIGSNAMGFPFAIGHQARPLAELPARDAVGHGPVKRSSPHPNSSYFHRWTGADASLTWDVEVENGGTYEAILYYTCKEENLGCTVSLAAAHATTSLKITEAHDPPLEGPADDRSPRTESPMKVFRAVSIGKMDLLKGRQQLTLSASQLQNGEAIEVRRVMMRLLPDRETN
jgi:arylsulfatase A-like enzyme